MPSSAERTEPRTSLPLAGAVDALARSARRGGRPGSIWLAGFVYQGLSLGWTFAFTIAQLVAGSVLPAEKARAVRDLVPAGWSGRLDPLRVWDAAAGPSRWLWLVLLVLILPVPFRLMAGLAQLAPAEAWARARARRGMPSLARAWRAGRGLSRSALWLWTQVLWMTFLAALLFFGTCQLALSMAGLAEDHPLRALAYGLTIAMIAVYGFVLAVLFQLALHSLVQNRRGVGSALLHAWRIVRNDPASTARATAVDLVLYLVVSAFQWGLLLAIALGTRLVTIAGMEGVATIVALPGVLLVLVLEAFAGSTRCAFWAQTYRALGGISTLAATTTPGPAKTVASAR